jgi:hypothetical protein
MTVPTLAPGEQDLMRIVHVVRQLSEGRSNAHFTALGGFASNVNLNATGDTAITIAPSATQYRVQAVLVKNKGTTASLSTARAGLFTAAGGGGLALAADQALSAITANAVNTDANMLALTTTVGARAAIDASTLYFRVGTAQGAAATADVYVYIQPLP